MIALPAVASALQVPAAAPARELPYAGAGVAGKEQIAQRRAALREARATWRRRRLRNYHYRIERLCFCPPEFRGPVRITVRDGRPRGTAEPFRDVDTVRELFQTVEELISAYELSVRYDRRGVPRRIEADRIEHAIDDEISYVVSRFRRLRPPR